MAYRTKDLQEKFGSEGKPISRTTIWRWVKKGLINPPDVMGAHPLWLKLPVKSNETNKII